jgi:hypothetical protein
MAINWKNVIEDKSKFPDDANFTLAGESISFGELRKQNLESRGELERDLTTRSAKLDERDRTQQRAVDTLARVLENVSAATGLSYDQLVKGQIPQHMRSQVNQITASTPTAAGIPLKDDPLYKPLFDGVLAPMANDMNLVKRGLGEAIGAYKNDHTRLAWLDWTITGNKPADFKSTYEEVLQHAVNRDLKDDLGFPDVRRAAGEMASPIVKKTNDEQVRKEGYDEGFKAAKKDFLANLGRPAGAGGATQFDNAPETGKNGQPVSIRQQLEKAFEDPDIAGTLFTVQ